MTLLFLNERRRFAIARYLGFSRGPTMESEPRTSAEGDTLRSWREIALYMGKGVRTVQRWEQDFGLPVHRVENCPRRAIFARPNELDAWAINCCETSTVRSDVRAEVHSSIRRRAERLATLVQANEQTVFRARAVLTSWKEIAQYLGCGVRTVQRWEKDFGLPVRRPLGSSKKAILARPCEVENWLNSWPNFAPEENHTEMMQRSINSISLSGKNCGLDDASGIGISSRLNLAA